MFIKPFFYPFFTNYFLFNLRCWWTYASLNAVLWDWVKFWMLVWKNITNSDNRNSLITPSCDGTVSHLFVLIHCLCKWCTIFTPYCYVSIYLSNTGVYTQRHTHTCLWAVPELALLWRTESSICEQWRRIRNTMECMSLSKRVKEWCWVRLLEHPGSERFRK